MDAIMKTFLLAFVSRIQNYAVLVSEKKTCKAIRSSPETLDPEPSTDTCETGSYIKPDVYFGVTASPCLVFPAGSRLLLN
jgi:hypothetical protein